MPYDPELYAKLKKSAGLSWEETQKTIQLKSEIDKLVVDQQKNDFLTSSEDSSCSHDNQGSQWDLSPHSREKLKIETKYKKKLTKVMETFIDRVDN